MVRVGVIGLGMMGLTHLDAYKKRGDCEVVALSDRDPDRLAGKVKAAGNVEGQAQDGVEAMDVKRYSDGEELIADPDVDLIDICLPTHLHLDYALKALASGKHVMIEKPLARTSADAKKIADAAETAEGMAFVGMCMRFWPGWTAIKEAVDQGTYGKVLSATFRRTASHPGGPFYSDGEKSGGALLDLHIHDTDFVHYVFGVPKAVSTAGYKKHTSEWDHVVTRYFYDEVPIVIAEGSWAMSSGYGFNMYCCVNFEQATMSFDLASDPKMKLIKDGKAEAIDLGEALGYDLEIGYFLDCIAAGTPPTTVTLADAVNTIRICEAEARSAASGSPETP